MSKISSVWQSDTFYFKAGAYLGANESNGSGCGQTWFRALSFNHNGVVTSSTQPTPTPNPMPGTGALSYDADGTGSTAAVKFASSKISPSSRPISS